MIATQYINLNMVPSGVLPVLHCTQYDVGRPLGVVVYDSAGTVDLDSYTVTIEGTRSDGTPITAAVTTDNEVGVFTTTATMTNNADQYLARLVIVDGDSNRVGSLPFVMRVVEKTMDENAESIAEDQSLYQQYTATVQTIIAEIRQELNGDPYQMPYIKGDGSGIAWQKVYVTPQMFGAVPNDQSAASLNVTAFQSAVDSGFPVVIPVGNYYLNAPIYIRENGVFICGCGSEETGSVLRFSGTDGIVVLSGYRLVTIKDLCLISSAYTGAAINVSYQSGSPSGSCHFLTVENINIVNFKYGILTGGFSNNGSGDSNTFLWNCAFRDIKVNASDDNTTAVGLKILYNGTTNFGLIFERVYFNGSPCCADLSATKCAFRECNFGIKATNAIQCNTVSDVVFEKCNFECDTKVTGALYSALIYATTKVTFIGCNFYALTAANVSFIGGGTASEFTFISNRSQIKTGNEMTQFFAQNLQSAKGSIVYAGGNAEVPRPDLYQKNKIQLLDLERSILPLKPSDAEEGTEYTGEIQFDVAQRTGGRPVWYDGAKWVGGVGGHWEYLDAVSAGATTTYTVTAFSDRPRTSIITVRGHHQDVYAIGIICKYRDASLATFVPMYANKCSIAVSSDTVTITNNATTTEYMYVSVVDLI